MSNDRHDRPPPSLGTLRPGRTAPDRAQGPVGATPPRSMRPGGAPPLPDPPSHRSAHYGGRQSGSDDARGGGVLKVLTLGLVGILALAVAGVGLLLVAAPTDMIRDRVVAEVKTRTGRDLVIAGKTSLTFLPSLGISLTDVTLSAPPTMPGPPLLKAAGLDVKIALLPLVTREVTVEHLDLKQPVIELRVDAQGRRSWEFAGVEAQPRRLQYAQVNPRGADGRPVPKELQEFVKNTSTPQSARARLGVNSIALDDVRITGGALRFADARTGSRQELTDLNARIAVKEANGPLEINGTFTMGGEKISLVGNSSSLTELLDERPTKVILRIESKPVELRYDGAVTLGHVPALDGRLMLKSASLDDVARLLQVPISGANGLGAVSIDGQVKVAGSSFGLSETNFTMADTKADGSLALELGGARPLIKANLKLSALDVNQLSGRFDAMTSTAAPSVAPRVAPVAPIPPAPTVRPAAAAPPPTAVPAPAAKEPKSIEDLLKQPGTAVRGFTRRSSDGWSSEAIDSAMLRLVDVEGRFEIASLRFADAKLGPSTSALQLKAGQLKFELLDAQLYAGKARGMVTVDAREPTMTVGANISGDGFAMQALLKDAAGVDVIDGRGRLVVAVSAKGGSERELVGTLGGKAELHLADGIVHGWDAGQMIAGLAQGRIPSPDRVPGAKTPFKLLAGSFQIQHGVARTQDLKLDSPALNGVGAGVINLVDRNINLTVKPKPASIGGVGGIEIPLRVAGPWDSVSVMPDAGGILKSQPAQDAIKKLKDGDVDGALDKVLGKGSTNEKIERGRGLLKQFLNSR